MDEPKVFICIEEIDGKAEFIDWVVTCNYDEVKEMYPVCAIEELPMGLILQELQITKEE